MGYSGTDGVQQLKKIRARREKRQRLREIRETKSRGWLHISQSDSEKGALSENDRLRIQAEVRQTKLNRIRRHILGTLLVVGILGLIVYYMSNFMYYRF